MIGYPRCLGPMARRQHTMVGAHGRANLLTAWAGNMRNRKEPLAHSSLQRLVPSDQGPPTLPYCLKVYSQKPCSGDKAFSTRPWKEVKHGHYYRVPLTEQGGGHDFWRRFSWSLSLHPPPDITMSALSTLRDCV